MDWKELIFDLMLALEIDIKEKETCEIRLTIKFNDGNILYANHSKEVTMK